MSVKSKSMCTQNGPEIVCATMDTSEPEQTSYWRHSGSSVADVLLATVAHLNQTNYINRDRLSSLLSLSHLQSVAGNSTKRRRSDCTSRECKTVLRVVHMSRVVHHALGVLH